MSDTIIDSSSVTTLPFVLCNCIGSGKAGKVFSLMNKDTFEFKDMLYEHSEDDADSIPLEEESSSDTEEEDVEFESEPIDSSDLGEDEENEDGDSTLLETQNRVYLAHPCSSQCQVVAKVFRHLERDQVTKVFLNDIYVQMEVSLDDAELYIEEQIEENSQKYSFLSNRSRSKSNKLLTKSDFRIESNLTFLREKLTPMVDKAQYVHKNSEFVHEATVHSKICQELVDTNLSPHIIYLHQCYRLNNSTGFLLMERATTDLDSLFYDDEVENDCGVDLSDVDVISMYFQILFTVAALQKKFRFKHHDLHPGNVFLSLITADTMFQGEPLESATHFHYKIDNMDFYIPNCGLLVKLADFGFSSITALDNSHSEQKDNWEMIRFSRIDFDTLCTMQEEWGEWNCKYETNEGYDAQMLFSKYPFSKYSKFHSNQRLKRFIRKLQKSSLGIGGKNSKQECRPIKVSRHDAKRLIQEVFVKKNVAEWSNLTKKPTQGKTLDSQPYIVTLGDLDWF